MGGYLTTDPRICSGDEQTDYLIRSNRVCVFIKGDCPSCARALEIMNTLQLRGEIHVENLTGRHGVEEIEERLKELTGTSSVPSIFIGGTPVGGLTELVTFLSGSLVLLLVSAQQRIRGSQSVRPWCLLLHTDQISRAESNLSIPEMLRHFDVLSLKDE
ncbi:glutaredoxin-1 [Cystoisospora suis]|uniref:Glutaredoxin-1 n=1 Tax=Cystoisospora suis TaxID=483139 RepID=A0A2C6L0L5_9APIC|nr:glutaredoxin-1 [Cystoisospora suis]